MATHHALRDSAPPAKPESGVVHPLWVRITHWLNALAVIVMMLSGWQIYDASPIFPAFRFPPPSRSAAGSAAPCNGISR